MNRDAERQRLVELIEASSKKVGEYIDNARIIPNVDVIHGMRADYLIENGVIVPPVKVGQTVFVVSRYYVGDWEIYQCEVDAITIYDKNTFISCVAKDVRFGKINFGLNISEFGKTVFLTREEAEKMLKGEGK